MTPSQYDGEVTQSAWARHFRCRRDVYGGLTLVLVGTGVVAEGARHTIGTLTRMGSGYFPAVLGVILALLGGCIAMSGSMAAPGQPETARGEEVHPPDLRGCTAIVAGVLAFAVFGAYFGFAAGTFGLVFISAIGDRTMTLKGAFALAAGMTAVAAGVFWYLLEIPFQLVTW